MTTATRTDIPRVYADDRAVRQITCKLRKRGLHPHQELLQDSTYRVWVEGEHEVHKLLANYGNGHDPRCNDSSIGLTHEIIVQMLEECCSFHTCAANGLLYCEDAELCARWFALPDPHRQGRLPDQLLPHIKKALGQTKE